MEDTSGHMHLSEEESEAVGYLTEKYCNITNMLADELLTRAETFLLHGNVNEALHASKLAIAASKCLKDPLKLAQSLGTQGNVLVKMGCLKEALDIYLTASQLLEQDHVLSAIVYGSIGNIYINMGNTSEALFYHEKALKLCEREEYNTVQIGALTNLGIDYYKIGDYKKALSYLERALKMCGSLDGKKEADIHSNIGVVALELGDSEKALYHLREGVNQHRSLQLVFEQASDSLNIGNIYYERGQLKKALFWYKKSKKLYRKMGSMQGEAYTDMSIGNVFLKRGNIKRALKNMEDALILYRSLEDATGIADVHANMGLVYSVQGDMQNAVKCYEKAASVYASAGNKVGEATQITQLGSMYCDSGDYEKALQYYNQSLSVYKTLEYPKGEASTYNDLGLAQYYRGEFTEALECFQKAVTIYETIQFTEGVGRTCGNIANVFYSAGEYEKAVDWHEKALKIFEKGGFQKEMANALINIGNVLYSTGKRERALKAYEEALNVSLKVGYEKGQIEAYTNMGVAYHDSDTGRSLQLLEKGLTSAGDKFPLVEVSMYLTMGLVHVKMDLYDRALWCYTNALKISEKNGYCELEQKACENLGRLHDLKGDYDEAFLHYERAISCSEMMRDRIRTPSMETRLAGKEDIYEMIVALAVRVGNVRKAFKYMERAKSRTLVKSLRRNKVLQEHPLLREAQILENEINYIYYQTLRKGDIMVGLLEKRKSLKELQKVIATACPDYAEMHFGIGTELEEIQKIKAQILEYFIMKNSILALYVSGSHVEYRILAIPPVCKEVISKERPVFLKFTSLQETLYRAFVQPFETYLDDTPLCIVPHGFLHHFPFGALHDGSNYLVEKYRIFYAPSATVLKSCLERDSEKSKQYLVCGYFGEGRSEVEVSTIAALLGTEPAQPHLDSFLKEYLNKDIIHIACHGEFLQADPLGSYIEFQDKRLDVQTVFNLDLRTDLVVLSACESGVNEVAGGDDLMGLERAFLFAGAKSLVHLLWPVYGLSTRELIVHFYENLTNGQSKLDSLRNAQLEMLHTNRFHNPFYWAPFVLVGDWRYSSLQSPSHI